MAGRWSIEGEAKSSPYGPAGKIVQTDTTEWLLGGFFLSHRYAGRQGAIEFPAMEIMGYDTRSKVYTSRTFDAFGNSGSWKGTVQGNRWTWTGESEVAGKALKERCTVDVGTPPNNLAVKCEYSTDGTTWLPNMESKWTRLK